MLLEVVVAETKWPKHHFEVLREQMRPFRSVIGSGHCCHCRAAIVTELEKRSDRMLRPFRYRVLGGWAQEMYKSPVDIQDIWVRFAALPTTG